MSRIDFFTREVHHAAHAWAIYSALPEQYQGVFTSDITTLQNDHVAVFCYGDLKAVDKLEKKIVFGEHGIGAYYNIVHPSYAGSTVHRKHIVLRLSPNIQHATKERETLTCPVEIIGVPKMDKWADRTFSIDKENPTVALSFHFDVKVCPETRSAFRPYVRMFPYLRAEFQKIIGHGHPRLIEHAAGHYIKNNIPIERDIEVVMEHADVYVCENSSTIFEFAFLRKPVVLINREEFRRSVTHSGNPRFWKYADIGPQVNNPEDLSAGIWEAVNNFENYLPRIEEMRQDVFTFTDGSAAQRAANAIVAIL